MVVGKYKVQEILAQIKVAPDLHSLVETSFD